MRRIVAAGGPSQPPTTTASSLAGAPSAALVPAAGQSLSRSSLPPHRRRRAGATTYRLPGGMASKLAWPPKLLRLRGWCERRCTYSLLRPEHVCTGSCAPSSSALAKGERAHAGTGVGVGDGRWWVTRAAASYKLDWVTFVTFAGVNLARPWKQSSLVYIIMKGGAHSVPAPALPTVPRVSGAPRP